MNLKDETLTPADYAALAARWIDSTTADAAGLRRTDSSEGGAIVGRNGPGDYSGLLIPYTWPGADGIREYRLRVDHPPMERDHHGNQKPQYRYLSPPGRANMLYFPRQIDPGWLDEPSISVVLTEGEFKTLALYRLATLEGPPAFLPVGLPGVWNWRGVIGKTSDETGTRVDVKGAIADFDRIVWTGRRVVIAFDADIQAKSSVRAALLALTRELERRGAVVHHFPWPAELPPALKGIDDYLAAKGPKIVLRMIEDATGSKPPSRPLTEIGLAERFVGQHGADTRYCHASGSWFVYGGTRWQEDETAEVERMAKATIRRLYDEAASEPDGDRRQAIAKFAAKSDSDVTIRRMLNRAAAEADIPVKPSEFDLDPELLNCANGVVNLRTGELTPHRRELMLTKLVPIAYDPRATSATWNKFLETVTVGDRAVAEFLQLAIGYSATGLTTEEKLFFVFGPGGTGKSTFLEACKSVLGCYSWVSDFESFIQRSAGGAVRSDIAELGGRRFVVSVEVDDGLRLAEGLVKHLTGGDTVRARQLYQRGFEFVPQFKLWLCANHAPRVSDDDSGMWRRILRIPFETVIPVEQRDTGLKARLKRVEERAAILAWIVEGAVRWYSEGLMVPKRILAATEEYRQEQDPLREFFQDTCEFDPEAWVAVASLRAAYTRYSTEAGIRSPLGPRPFSDRLRQRGALPGMEGSGTQRIRVWRGIRVKE